MGDGFVSIFVSRGCVALERVDFVPSWAAATSTVASDGKRRRRSGEGRLLNFIVVYIQFCLLDRRVRRFGVAKSHEGDEAMMRAQDSMTWLLETVLETRCPDLRN
jgi:hypothetical protein